MANVNRGTLRLYLMSLGLSRRRARTAVRVFFEVVTAAILRGEKVEFGDFLTVWKEKRPHQPRSFRLRNGTIRGKEQGPSLRFYPWWTVRSTSKLRFPLSQGGPFSSSERFWFSDR
jgi:hypothetical protein